MLLNKISRLFLLFAVIVAVASMLASPSDLFLASAQAQATAERPKLDVHYVPTPHEVVAAMLKMAKVTKDDVVYDLGCGDGRIVIAAAKQYGARGVGIDLDPDRIKEARQNAEQAGVADRVKFIEGDLFQQDLSDASVVTLYLLSEINMRLRPKLFKELRPGSRVVSHSFNMGDWEPKEQAEVNNSRIYFWVIPEKSAQKTE